MSIVRNDLFLSHLFLADDLILFAEASSDQMLVIKECLDTFYSRLGQRLNYKKSNIFFFWNLSGG